MDKLQKKEGLRQTAVNVGLTFGRQFLAGIVQLIIVLMIGRLLGAKEMGVYSVSLLMPMMLGQLLNLGLASSNIYFLASRQFELAIVWQVSRNVAVVMSIIGLLIGTAFIMLFGTVAFPGIEHKYLLLAMLIFPFTLCSGLLASIYQGLEDFRSYNIQVLLQPVLAFLCILCLWGFGQFDLAGVLIATVISHICTLIAGIIFIRNRVAILSTQATDINYLRPAIGYGIFVHLGNIVGFLIYRIDLYLINFFLGPAAAGIYNVAVRLVEQLWMVSQAVSTVIFPRLSAMVGNEAARRELTPMIARMVLWLTLAAGCALAILSEPLIGILFGASFADAAYPLFALLPGVVLLSCARVLANDLAARGKVISNLILTIGVLVVNVFGCVLLIPAYGIVGAGIATTIAYGSNLVIRLVLQQRLSSTPWWQFVVLQKSDVKRLLALLRSDRKAT
jgi:O-antigen/teichoic acid export membrane protein